MPVHRPSPNFAHANEVAEIIVDLGVVDIENAVGSRLALVELGVAQPLTIEGRYRLLRLLGRGARGVVCLAHDVHLHRKVALKLYPAYEPGPAAQEVASEAQALARLKHVNVVGVYDFGDTTLALEAGDLGRLGDHRSVAIPCFFMSMEHVHGQSLRRWLAGAERDRTRILAAFAQAGEGLAHAHEAGVVHRDFKPENVMLEDTGRVSVVDFGLASRRVGTRITTTTALVRWQPPAIVGTLEYMAPEARIGQANAASDQYSFAVSLHEALLGSLPPLTSAGIAYVDARRFPAAIARVLTRALALEAQHRYPSMRALLDDLPRRWDAQWRWTTLDDEASPRRRPRWLPWALGGALVVGLGLGLWAAITAMLGPDESPPSAGSTIPAETTPAGFERACAADVLVDRWQLASESLWTYDWDLRGVRGDYELVIERRDPSRCDYLGILTMHGSSRGSYKQKLIAEAPITVIGPAPPGVFEVVGDWNLDGRERHVHFDLFIEGDTIRGDFRRFVTPKDRRERPAFIGPARGVRWGGSLPDAATFAAVPCASQCNMACAGIEATRICRALRCIEPDGPIDECGPPSPDFAEPYTTRVKLLAGDWEPLTRKCDERIAAVAGEWTIAERFADGETRTWTLNLAARGCTLVGHARSHDGHAHELVGAVDVEARWLVEDRWDPAALRWAMMGWELAFGSAGGRRQGALAGQKRR